jgi:hypothetical protein
MKREVAGKPGNFRRVCPLIGRDIESSKAGYRLVMRLFLRRQCALRHTMSVGIGVFMSELLPQYFGFFMSRNETPGRVLKFSLVALLCKHNKTRICIHP